jgi:hypothetical protein
MIFTISLNYNPYKVPISSRKTQDVTLNATLGRSWQSFAKAKKLMRGDALVLTLQALQAAKHGARSQEAGRSGGGDGDTAVSEGESIRVASTVFVGVRHRRRDQENVLAGLKWAFDGIAQALEVDDSRFVHEPVQFEAGPNETRIEVSW